MTRADDRPRKPSAACPVCGNVPVQAYRPFCSKRCADVDLHRWLGGSYVIQGAPEEMDSVPEGGASQSDETDRD